MYIGQKNRFRVIYKSVFLLLIGIVSVQTVYADCTKVDTTLEAIKCLEEKFNKLSTNIVSSKISVDKEIFSLDKEVSRVNDKVKSNNVSLNKTITNLDKKVNSGNVSLGKNISSLKNQVNTHSRNVSNLKNTVTSNSSLISKIGKKTCSTKAWVGRGPLVNKSSCPAGQYVKGVNFKHPRHQNGAYQMSYQLVCCKL